MNKVLRRAHFNRSLLKQVYNHSSARHLLICSNTSLTKQRGRPHSKIGLSTKPAFHTGSRNSCRYKSCSEKSIDNMSQHIVGHDKTKKCFYIKLKDSSPTQNKAMALLEYEWVRPGLVNMYHTEVPPEFQGQGIAKILAKTAFDTFCEQGVLMRPTCTYLQKFLRDNPTPRYMDHVDKEFALFLNKQEPRLQ